MMNQEFIPVRRARQKSHDGEYLLSSHAQKRMSSRGLSKEALRLVFKYGRCIFTRGARFFILGKKELQHYRSIVNLDALQGIQIVCHPKEEVVITVYRNHDFRSLRAA